MSQPADMNRAGIPAPRRFDLLTWTGVGGMPEKGRAVLILPLGSLEQHGPHLPLDTDAAIVESLLAEIAARDAHIRYPDLWVFPRFLWEGLPAQAPDAGLGLDLHAGRAETSLMLAVRPDAVRVEAAVSEFPPDVAAPAAGATPAAGPPEHRPAPIPFAWATRDLSASGVIGDARAASADEGRRLLAALVGWLMEEIGAIYAFRLPPR